MTTLTEVSAAAPPAVAALLDGPARRALVISAGPHALYAADGTRVLAVLGRDAVAVPCGLQTLLPVLPDVAHLVLGGGRCEVGDHAIVVRRYVDPGVPRLGPLDGGAWPDSADAALVEVSAEVPQHALDALRDADPAAVPLLLGRGSGLTPVGDDVLSGWLVTRRAIGSATDAVATAVGELAATRTTPLSAALLGHAVAGECVPQLRTALLALATGVAVEPALAALLAVGHTSGAGLVLGLRLAVLSHEPQPISPLFRRSAP